MADVSNPINRRANPLEHDKFDHVLRMLKTKTALTNAEIGTGKVNIGGRSFESRVLQAPEQEIFDAEFMQALGTMDSATRNIYMNFYSDVLKFVAAGVIKHKGTFKGSLATGSAIGWTLPFGRGVQWGNASKRQGGVAAAGAFGIAAAPLLDGWTTTWVAADQNAWVPWLQAAAAAPIVLSGANATFSQLHIGMANDSATPSMDEIRFTLPDSFISTESLYQIFLADAGSNAVPIATYTQPKAIMGGEQLTINVKPRFIGTDEPRPLCVSVGLAQNVFQLVSSPIV